MGLHRDLVFFRTTTGTHFVSSIAAGSLTMVNLDATSPTHIRDGEVVGDNTRLRGRITHMAMSLNMATSLAVRVVFYANRTGPTTNPDTDRILDYEDVAVGDWWVKGGQTAPRKVVKSGLDLPYFDAGGRREFHVGILNRSTTAIPGHKLVLEFSWRADMGVHT